jgi:hypothetical protein
MSTEDMPEKPSEESSEWHWARASTRQRLKTSGRRGV